MTPDEQYFWTEKNGREYVQLIEAAIPKNFEAGKIALAAANYGRLANSCVELGVLHWRRGIDPRADFERGIVAYGRMSELARQHALQKNIQEIPYVYAMLSLMDQPTAIEFEDEAYHKEHRWPCYQCCLVHALHNQGLNSYHDNLLNTYLGENEDLPDRIFRTYFELLEGASPDRLVQLADSDWTKRKTHGFFSGAGPACDGHAVMNDLHVDLYLAAVLKKIGWQGESIHRWKW